LGLLATDDVAAAAPMPLLIEVERAAAVRIQRLIACQSCIGLVFMMGTTVDAKNG
jgi:hypothetical protein